jgi:hypothetical protein
VFVPKKQLPDWHRPVDAEIKAAMQHANASRSILPHFSNRSESVA